MQNIISNITLIAFISMLGLASCKSVSEMRQNPMLTMPGQFSSATDTTAMNQMNWREFFEDESLVALIDTALSNNLDLKIALQRIEAARSETLATKGALLPTVDAVGTTGIDKFGRYTMDGAGNRGTEMINGKDVPVFLPDYSLGLVAGWEIDAWGKLRSRKKAAINRYLASIEGRHFVQTNLIATVAGTYYELQALDAQTVFLEEAIALQTNALEVVRAQKEAGKATQLGIQQFEAQLLTLKGMQLELQQQIFQQEAELNFLLGRYPQPIPRNVGLLDTDVPARIDPGIPSALLENRPDVRQAALELAATKADLDAARAMFYPSVNISGILGIQAFRPDLLITKPQSFTLSLLGGIAAPLVNKRAIQAAFDFADATQVEALFNYQQVILNAYIEVNNQMANIQNLRKMLDFKNEESGILLQSVSTSADLFRTGRANYLEILAAQQNALDARLELAELKKRLMQSTVEMYRSLGGGWR